MKSKAFDCVEMKNRIQQDLLALQKQVGACQVRKDRQAWLAEGGDDLSRLWLQYRRHKTTHGHLTVGEDPS